MSKESEHAVSVLSERFKINTVLEYIASPVVPKPFPGLPMTPGPTPDVCREGDSMDIRIHTCIQRYSRDVASSGIPYPYNNSIP